ncbi:uncharacterized protein [Leptinotarsa decemlineata]|uniref:uncharacterized protein n=1 Tax=Leptinotarsa decemlineata TaxID=7539 RepID=UPI003D303F8F
MIFKRALIVDSLFLYANCPGQRRELASNVLDNPDTREDFPFRVQFITEPTDWRSLIAMMFHPPQEKHLDHIAIQDHQKKFTQSIRRTIRVFENTPVETFEGAF